MNVRTYTEARLRIVAELRADGDRFDSQGARYGQAADNAELSQGTREVYKARAGAMRNQAASLRQLASQIEELHHDTALTVTTTGGTMAP